MNILPSIVKINSVRCTLTNLDAFRKLSSVTHECGKIKTRLDDVFESILISDKLREASTSCFYQLTVFVT